VTGQRL